MRQDAAARQRDVEVIGRQLEVATSFGNGRRAELHQSSIALYNDSRIVASMYKLLLGLHREIKSRKTKIYRAKTFTSVHRKSHAKKMETKSGKCAALKKDMAALRDDYDTYVDKAAKH